MTTFRIDQQWASRYEVHTAGGKEHLELWVPAEELDSFNEHLIGLIEVLAEFR